MHLNDLLIAIAAEHDAVLRAISSGPDPYAVVFEDDVFVPSDLVERIADALEDTGLFDFDASVDGDVAFAVMLDDSFCENPAFQPPAAVLERAVAREALYGFTKTTSYAKSSSRTTGAYVVSREAARVLTRSPHWLPQLTAVDWQLNAALHLEHIPTFWVWPPVVCHGSKSFVNSSTGTRGAAQHGPHCCDAFYSRGSREGLLSPHRREEAPQRKPALADVARVLRRARIEAHLDSHAAALRAATACRSPEVACSPEWRAREKRWRQRALAAERGRLELHASLFDGDFLPRAAFKLGERAPSSYLGSWTPFDYWEAEYPCEREVRLPHAVFGDGPKWLCGPECHEHCTSLCVGSNFEDSFESAIAKLGCRSYVVDPTLARFGSEAESRRQIGHFAAQLETYGAHLNASVGVGRGTLRFQGRQLPLVDVFSLLRDDDVYNLHAGDRTHRPASQYHLSFLKADVGGAEYDMTNDLFALCESGAITVDQLNLELHAFSDISRIHKLFAGALKCNLVLHHKEPNTWGCGGVRCTEFSWVSLDHARRVSLDACRDVHPGTLS